MSLPPLYCVTLAEEPWKGRLAAAHFKERGIDDVRFVYGVQGVTIGLRPTNPFEFDPYGESTFLHPATLGCLVSHRIALSAALASDAEHFIICEDDVELVPDFVQRWERDFSPLSDPADVVQLEYCSHEDKRVEGIDGTPLATCEPYPFCAACIWWTRDAAMQALSLMRPLDRSYDIMLIERVFPFLRHAIAMPAMATQRSNKTWPSSIYLAPHT